MGIGREVIGDPAINSTGFTGGNILMKNGAIGQRHY
jgi:hypothetical protein